MGGRPRLRPGGGCFDTGVDDDMRGSILAPRSTRCEAAFLLRDPRGARQHSCSEIHLRRDRLQSALSGARLSEAEPSESPSFGCCTAWQLPWRGLEFLVSTLVC